MRAPSTLRLPFWAAERFRIEQILATELDCSWSEGWALREQFALSGPETVFARVLLRDRRNLWLFRCNQRHFCGDFVAIDMSAPRDRTTYALELKAGEAVREGVGGVRLAGLDRALAELGTLRGDGPVITAQGDGPALLAWMRHHPAR